MNKKKTNYFVTVLNILTIAIISILYFNFDFLEIIDNNENMYKYEWYLYENTIISEILKNYTWLVVTCLICFIGFFNIVCAFQNKKNKKICFSYLIFALYEIIRNTSN